MKLSIEQKLFLLLVQQGRPTAGLYGLRQVLLNRHGLLFDELGILKSLQGLGLIEPVGYNYRLTVLGDQQAIKLKPAEIIAGFTGRNLNLLLRYLERTE